MIPQTEQALCGQTVSWTLKLCAALRAGSLILQGRHFVLITYTFHFLPIQTIRTCIDWHLKGNVCEEMLWSSRTNPPQHAAKRNLLCVPPPPSVRSLGIFCHPTGISATARWHFEHNTFTGSDLFVCCLHLGNREGDRLNYSLLWQ